MSLLFTPKSIGKMEIKNRIVRSPTGDRRATTDGMCTDSILELYEDLADGGSGLLITGATYVQPNGRGLPRMIGMHKDEVIAGYKKVTDIVHKYGAKIATQLWHTGRHVTPDFECGTPIAPSPVKVKLTGLVPREMTEEDIQDVIENYGQAARRTKESGFDAIQLHGAHGYLIHSFLAPRTNLRKDKWGGSFENRMRFLLEVYAKTREVVGDDYPIMIKMNVEDYAEGGINIDLSKRIAEKLCEIGIDAIEISAGLRGERHFNMARGDIPKDYVAARVAGIASKYRQRQLIKWLKDMAPEVKFEEGYLRPFARELKKVINVPLILPGGLRTVRVMEDVLESGDADFVGLCRPLVRDPDFPNKIRKGRIKRSDCLNCNLCLGNRPINCYQKLYRPPHL